MMRLPGKRKLWVKRGDWQSLGRHSHGGVCGRFRGEKVCCLPLEMVNAVPVADVYIAAGVLIALLLSTTS
jgi:hypothetical protein